MPTKIFCTNLILLPAAFFAGGVALYRQSAVKGPGMWKTVRNCVAGAQR